MSNSDNNVLHLDDILGQHKGMEVDWKGESYPLKRINDLTPEEHLQMMVMGERFTTLGLTLAEKNERDPNVAKEVLEAVETMMKMIAPELHAKGLPFNGQMVVLTFWKEQQEGKTKKKTVKPSK